MVFKFRVKVLMYCQIPVPAGGMNSELKELPDYLEKRPVFEAKA